jgi:hypothetical protein
MHYYLFRLDQQDAEMGGSAGHAYSFQAQQKQTPLAHLRSLPPGRPATVTTAHSCAKTMAPEAAERTISAAKRTESAVDPGA